MTAKTALERVSASLQGTTTLKGVDERYNRTNNRDFQRKANSYAPILINDGYSNFRFSKRAIEVLSPLSKSKFGITT